VLHINLLSVIFAKLYRDLSTCDRGIAKAKGHFLTFYTSTL